MSTQISSFPAKRSWSTGTVATIDGAAVGDAVGAEVAPGVGVALAPPHALAIVATMETDKPNLEIRAIPQPPLHKNPQFDCCARHYTSFSVRGK